MPWKFWRIIAITRQLCDKNIFIDLIIPVVTFDNDMLFNFCKWCTSCYFRCGYDDLLPATIEYRDDAEEEFIRAVCSDINVEGLEFKLIPTYIVYMAARHCFSRRQLSANHQLRRAATFTSLAAHSISNTLQVIYRLSTLLNIYVQNI